MEFVFIKRLRDGVVLDIPKSHLEMTLKQGGFELVSTLNYSESVPEATDIPEIPVSNDFGCPLCDKRFKTEHGLKVHKASHK